MIIDPDANVSDLCDSWVNGNCNDVVDALAGDHPGLAAFVTMELMRRDECLANALVNRLTDDRVERLAEIERHF